MECLNKTNAGVLALVALLTGCTASPPSDPAPVTPSSIAATAPETFSCTELGDYPELSVDRLIARLPLKNLDPLSYSQSELQTLRGQGTCIDHDIQPVANECNVVQGTLEGTEGLMLWRPAGFVMEKLFAEGTTRLLTVEVTVDASDGDWFFKYRMTAIDYADPTAAAESTPINIAQACHAAAEQSATRTDDGRFVLRKGEEPFLIVVRRGSTIIVVEPRIVTIEGRTGRYPDTETGLLPDDGREKCLRPVDRVGRGVPSR